MNTNNAAAIDNTSAFLASIAHIAHNGSFTRADLAACFAEGEAAAARFPGDGDVQWAFVTFCEGIDMLGRYVDRANGAPVVVVDGVVQV